MKQIIYNNVISSCKKNKPKFKLIDSEFMDLDSEFLNLDSVFYSVKPLYRA